MRSTTTSKISPRVALGVAGLTALLLTAGGCGQINNNFVETGPFTYADVLTPSAKLVFAQYTAAPVRHRDWQPTATTAASGVVIHGPLYFEDPFEDKGTGHHGVNKYHIGWEDFIAPPYGLARFTLNTMFAWASAIVTPPWTKMESDGVISRQYLGYDHDATPIPDQPLGPPFGVPDQPRFVYIRPMLPAWSTSTDADHERPLPGSDTATTPTPEVAPTEPLPAPLDKTEETNDDTPANATPPATAPVNPQ